MLYLGLQITTLTLCIIGSTLHSIGSYLLVCLYKNGEDHIQQLLIINLSLTEIIGCLLGIVEFSTEMSISLGNTSTTVIKLHKYTGIFMSTGFVCMHFLCVIYIAFDRMFEIYLNIKYSVYFNNTKAKYLIKSIKIVF